MRYRFGKAARPRPIGQYGSVRDEAERLVLELSATDEILGLREIVGAMPPSTTQVAALQALREGRLGVSHAKNGDTMAREKSPKGKSPKRKATLPEHKDPVVGIMSGLFPRDDVQLLSALTCWAGAVASDVKDGRIVLVPGELRVFRQTLMLLREAAKRSK